MSVSVNKIKVAKLTVREMYILKDIDDNKITVNRLSRNEKAILSTLRIYDELGSSYQWPVLPDVYFRCFPPWEMEEYYKGHRVPLWMIKRDCGIKHASSLSRTLKTLLDKDLIYPHGYDMGVRHGEDISACQPFLSGSGVFPHPIPHQPLHTSIWPPGVT